MSKPIWDDPKITAYVLGELSEEQRIEFENELASNGELSAAVDEARDVTGRLEQLYASEPTPPLDAERRSVIAAGKVQTASPAKQNSRSWKTPATVLAIAAVLLLLLGVPAWLAEEGTTAVTQTTETASEEMPEPMMGMAAELEGSIVEESLQESEEEPSEMRSMAIADQGQTQADGPQADGPQADGPQAEGPQAEVPGKMASDSLAAGSQAVRRGGQAGGADQTRQSTARRLDRPAQPSSSPAVANRSATVAGSQPGGRTSERKNQAAGALPPAPAGQAPASNAMAMGEAGGKDVSRRIGDVEVESVPEIGGMVLRGAKRDVRQVEKRIQRAEAATPAPEMPALSLAGPANDRARFAYQDGAETLKKEAAKGVSSPTANEAVPMLGKKPMQVAVVEAPAGRAQPSPVASRSIASAQEKTREVRGGRAYFGSGPFGVDYGLPVDEGRGPGVAGDRFEPINDNPFKRALEHSLSTFSVDVDTASYSKTRDFLMRANQLPRPDAVRIEELINYFDYEYDPPSDSDTHPFAAHATVTACPWNREHRLARIALKGKAMRQEDRPACNLVFLLDTSGSMNAPNKMPLVVEGMQMLLGRLNEKDKVAIAVYAGSAGLVLDSTSAKKRKKIRKALTELSAGGSTNGGAGIALAYQTARDNFIPDGVNRVILCTDGDFNVGTTGTDELVRMVERESKGGVFLSVLGFGMGNHNDAMLEKISGRGNGNYAFIDDRREAHKVLVNQTSGTLVTIAKDVKVQVEFNINQVSSYRLIGYENRLLAKEDFNDDKKDAGEIGAGHTVTALYEIVPVGVEADAGRPQVDDLKYQTSRQPTEAADNDEMMTIKLRYKQPDGDTSTLVEFPVSDQGGEFNDADHDVRFAAAVASFGMQLRRSQYAGNWTMSDVIRVADDARGEDMDGLRAEFVKLARKARELMGQQ